MITKIMKKEFNKIAEIRKHSTRSLGVLTFKGHDGKYYKCDKVGGEGLKEIFYYQKQLKKQLTDQESLTLTEDTA